MNSSKFNLSFVDKLKEILTDLSRSKKQYQKIGKSEVIIQLSPLITMLLKKGYSMSDISEILKENGFSISIHYLREVYNKNKIKRARKKTNESIEPKEVFIKVVKEKIINDVSTSNGSKNNNTSFVTRDDSEEL